MPLSRRRSNGEQHVIQKVPLNQLQEESRRLADNNPSQPAPRPTLSESLYSVVLSQILKPNSWNPSAVLSTHPGCFGFQHP